MLVAQNRLSHKALAHRKPSSELLVSPVASLRQHICVQRPWAQPVILVEQWARVSVTLDLQIVVRSSHAKETRVNEKKRPTGLQLVVATRRHGVTDRNRRDRLQGLFGCRVQHVQRGIVRDKKFKSMSEYASSVPNAALPPSHPATTSERGRRTPQIAMEIRSRREYSVISTTCPGWLTTISLIRIRAGSANFYTNNTASVFQNIRDKLYHWGHFLQDAQGGSEESDPFCFFPDFSHGWMTFKPSTSSNGS